MFAAPRALDERRRVRLARARDDARRRLIAPILPAYSVFILRSYEARHCRHARLMTH